MACVAPLQGAKVSFSLLLLIGWSGYVALAQPFEAAARPIVTLLITGLAVAGIVAIGNHVLFPYADAASVPGSVSAGTAFLIAVLAVALAVTAVSYWRYLDPIGAAAWVDTVAAADGDAAKSVAEDVPLPLRSNPMLAVLGTATFASRSAGASVGTMIELASLSSVVNTADDADAPASGVSVTRTKASSSSRRKSLAPPMPETAPVAIMPSKVRTLDGKRTAAAPTVSRLTGGSSASLVAGFARSSGIAAKASARDRETRSREPRQPAAAANTVEVSPPLPVPHVLVAKSRATEQDAG